MIEIRKSITVSSILFFLFLSAASIHGDLSAQQYFEPLKRGEYEVVEEDTSFHPGAKISGSYEAYAGDRREGLVTGDSFGGKFYQDIELSIQSKINTNVSLNVTVGHQSPEVSEQDESYDTRDPSEKSTEESGGGFNLVFKEAFLQYDHNPNARLKIGRHHLLIADRKGLVFEGDASAISQGCRIGTWCYSIGGARLGEEGKAALFWASLDYPVYESGVVIPDPWGEQRTRQEKSFSVEIYRVMYGGNDIPLAEYGGWTGRYSQHHDTADDTAAGDPVYFNNDGVEYIGLNIIWNHYDFDLNLTWSNLAGSRDYFFKNRNTGQGAALGSKAISGNAYLLDAGYRLTEEWKSTLRIFSASGNDISNDTEKIWDIDASAYYEVQKGSFGDALIYFDGKEGIGDGHSVANTSFLALKFSYRDQADKVGAEVNLYQFTRTKPVLVNAKGENERKSRKIGLELDTTVEWRLEERLFFSAFAAYFFAGDAYTVNDSLRPEADPSDFTLLGIGGRYTF